MSRELSDKIERADEVLLVRSSGGSGQFRRYEPITADEAALIVAALRALTSPVDGAARHDNQNRNL